LDPIPGQIRRRPGNSIGGEGGVGIWKNRVAFRGGLGYNFSDDSLLAAFYGVSYNDDCFSIGFQYNYVSNQFRTNGKENSFTFTIALPNIGNFVPFQGGGSGTKY
jgi:hypothetical protein